MRTVFKIAWGNTFQNLKRTFAALGGITFSVLLVFLQLGFLNAAKTQVTLLFDYFDFDAVIVGDRYQILATAPDFDRRRLIQASVDGDIVDSFKLNVESARWTNKETLIESSMLIIGMDDKPSFIANPLLRSGFETLRDGRSVMLDKYSHNDYGDRVIGQEAFIGNLEVEVTSLFELGLFFYAEGSIATDEGNFVRLSGRSVNEVTLGLLKIREGADVDVVVERIRGLVPDDVVVMSRETFYEEERGYFVNVKPIGIMFRSAVFVAFIVGLVILYQVLATELSNRMHEYATMKAMGFGSRFVYGIGITQNLLFVAFSYLPACLMAIAVFNLIYELTKMPTTMTAQLAITVLALSAGMGLIAGLLSMRKLQSADPADLY